MSNSDVKNANMHERAKELTGKLTLKEKISMIHGAQLFQTAPVERLGIPALRMSDGPMGVRQEFEPAGWKCVGNNDDHVTYLPCNSALASTWNRELARKTGAVLGEEARGRGKDVILGPGVNIKRSPLCGRNFEYFSEDPYLTAELAVPYIQGVQSWDVAACIKHFAVNNQETERLWVEVKIDEQALRDIYFPAFYDAVKKAGVYTVMGAYNLLYGEHCCQSKYLIQDILRKEWGFDGVVISDWGAVHDSVAAAESGLDIEMSVTDDFDQYYMADPLLKLVEEGKVSEKVIDEKVEHILVLMMRLHMMDGERLSGSYNTPEHWKAAYDVAKESVVLLKNDTGILPLSEKKTKNLLIVGENADLMHAAGGGSAEIKALYEITPYMGIKALLGGNAKVTYVKGYAQEPEKEEMSDENWQATSLENGGGTNREKTASSNGEENGSNCEQDMNSSYRQQLQQLRQEAVEAAKSADQVIFIGGLNHHQDSEGNDREDMKLPYEQDILIRELLLVNPDTVIVMVGGSPVEMGEWIDAAHSVIWSWYAGMEGGRALADVLFGRVNPSGKLPESFYKTHLDCSAHAVGEFATEKEVHYREGVFVGYRYLEDKKIEPQFCFGHGLSYTTFEYGEPRLLEELIGGKIVHFAECKVENTGNVAGKETVQVYLAPEDRKETEPVRELKGFQKVELEPGESTIVRIELSGYEDRMKVQIGSSLEDIRLEIPGKKGE